MAKTLAVIGGGAAGIISVIEAQTQYPDLNITIFERMPKLCKKLLVTGNGRCNFTNEDLSLKHFYGDNDFLKQVLTSVHADSENYFRSLGVLSYHEDGRIYPRAQQSAAVRDALLNKIDKSKVDIRLDTPVTSIKPCKNHFLVNGETFDAVIVAGGGKASPVQGSDGSCFELLSQLNHTTTRLYPALCGLKTNDKCINMLKGVRTEALASLYSDNRLLGEEEGEIQFTEKAISGIPVMNLSHLCKDYNNLKAIMDLCHEISAEELTEHFKEMKSLSPLTDTEQILSGVVNIKLGYAVMNKANIKPNTKAGKLTTKDISKLVNSLKCFELPITGTKDFSNAQITCGGIKTDEIHADTMMSRLHEGLFICGEILDIHGDCGGYNLHLAWTTGRIAGFSASNYLKG